MGGGGSKSDKGSESGSAPSTPKNKKGNSKDDMSQHSGRSGRSTLIKSKRDSPSECSVYQNQKSDIRSIRVGMSPTRNRALRKKSIRSTNRKEMTTSEVRNKANADEYSRLPLKFVLTLPSHHPFVSGPTERTSFNEVFRWFGDDASIPLTVERGHKGGRRGGRRLCELLSSHRRPYYFFLHLVPNPPPPACPPPPLPPPPRTSTTIISSSQCGRIRQSS